MTARVRFMVASTSTVSVSEKDRWPPGSPKDFEPLLINRAIAGFRVAFESARWVEVRYENLCGRRSEFVRALL